MRAHGTAETADEVEETLSPLADPTNVGFVVGSLPGEDDGDDEDEDAAGPEARFAE